MQHEQDTRLVEQHQQQTSLREFAAPVLMLQRQKKQKKVDTVEGEEVFEQRLGKRTA